MAWNDSLHAQRVWRDPASGQPFIVAAMTHECPTERRRGRTVVELHSVELVQRPPDHLPWAMEAWALG